MCIGQWAPGNDWQQEWMGNSFLWKGWGIVPFDGLSPFHWTLQPILTNFLCKYIDYKDCDLDVGIMIPFKIAVKIPITVMYH